MQCLRAHAQSAARSWHFHLQAAGVVGFWLVKFRVKPGVCAIGPVEKFAIDAQAGLGPDLLQKQAFPPAGMGHDHLGHKALFAQFQGRFPGGLAAQGFDFQIGHPAVRALAGAARHGITHQRHAGHGWTGIDVQSHYAVA